MKTEETCARCDEEKYEEFLNEILTDVKVGNFTFSPGRVLRELDPIAFSCGMSEIEDNLCEICQQDF